MSSTNLYAVYLRKSRADLEAEARGEGETLARHKKTLMGRARMIMKKPTNKPSPAMGSKSRGLTSKPKVRNMTIWKSQVNPSKKVVTLFLC